MKRAIKLGVHDYLMKSQISDGELEKIIREAEDELRANGISDSGDLTRTDYQEAIIKTELFKSLGGAEYNKDLVETSLIEKDLNDPLAVIMASGKRLSRLGDQQYGILAAGIKNIVNDLMQEYGKGYVFEYAKNSFLFLLSLRRNKRSKKRKELVEEFCKRVIMAIENYFNKSFSLGVCSTAKIKSLQEAIQRAKDALKLAYFKRGSGYYFKKYKPTNVQQIDFDTFKTRFIHALKTFEYDVMSDILDRTVIEVTSKPSIEIDKTVDHFVELYFVMKTQLQEYYPNAKSEIFESGNSFESIINSEDVFEIGKIFQDTLKSMHRITVNDRDSIYRNIVQKAKEYIKEHLGEQIDLNSIAEHVFLSPSYFSKVFKDTESTTFIDYVINEKIERAKAYINEGDKMSTVAAKVGYFNYNYFTKLFKNITGMTPGEYKKAHLKKVLP
jgi:two-component system response regulator YesN